MMDEHEGQTFKGPIVDPRAIEAAKPVLRASGGLNNYYLARVDSPQRGCDAYTAECEDIIDALELIPDEANIFKEIWRTANERKGNGKPGHKLLYAREKIVHYAGRLLKKAQRL